MVKTPAWPQEFTDRMVELLGNESSDFFDALNQKPRTSLRFNPIKPVFCNNADPVSWCRSGFYLKERPVFTLDPSFHAGAYFVQEASSMFIEQFISQLQLGSRPLVVLDLCAAPGGKSTHLLSLLHPDSVLIANETIRSRVAPLTENLVKWGYSNFLVSVNDPQDFESCHPLFDVILCDAPCSGEGLYRKDKSTTGFWTTQQIELCAARQKRIVRQAWKALKPGGIFIYSTCTFNKTENEDVIRYLVEEYRIAEGIRLHTGNFSGVHISEAENIPVYRFMPHRVRGEGFTIAALRKAESGASDADHGLRLNSASVYQPLFKNLKNAVYWVTLPEGFELFRKNNRVFLMNENVFELYQKLSRHLRIELAGTEVSELKNEITRPSHAVSQSQLVNRSSLPVVKLSHEDALRYLRGETAFSYPCPDGYCLMVYENLPLGFARKSNLRYNNLYPKPWRIRMKGHQFSA